MTDWERNAIFCQDEYNTYVNLKERYYICPFCGESVYEEDWSDVDLGNFLCPICEDEDEY